MSDYKLKALIATTPLNVSYFTDFDCWMHRLFTENMLTVGGTNDLIQSYALLPLDGEPALITKTGFGLYSEDLWVKDVRTYDPPRAIPKERDGATSEETFMRTLISKQVDDAAKALIGAMKDRSIRRGRVGLESANMSEATRKSLEKAFPDVDFLDCAELLRFIRMVKTADEIKRLKTADEISEKAIVDTISGATAGTEMSELIRSYSQEVAKEGAISDHVQSGPEGVSISEGTRARHRLKRGDFMFLDYGCTYKTYYSDSGDTLFIGKASGEALRLYKAIRDTLEEGRDILRAGEKPSVIIDELNNILKSRGIPPNFQAHGIGQEQRGYPIIMSNQRRAYDNNTEISDEVMRANVDVPLEENMVMPLEITHFIFGYGSVHVERTYLVGNGSAKELSKKKDLPSLTP
jgi:Xaa-Pro dipeptidase